jgi:hypothetical protein
MLYRFPEKVFIDTAKDLVGQLQRACLLAFEIYNIDLSHIELLWIAGALACALKIISSTYQQPLSLPPSTGLLSKGSAALLLRPRALLALSGARSALTLYFLDLPAAAFLAAFNGSSVVDPAKPRRSRGGFFAFKITT